jgi:phosphoglycolate phosphatase-like HAD superfamily hydrolase
VVVAVAAAAGGCSGGGEETAAPGPSATAADGVAEWRRLANSLCRELDQRIRVVGAADAAEAQLETRRKLGQLRAPAELRDDVRDLLAALEAVDRELRILQTAQGKEAEPALERLDAASARATRLAAGLGLKTCPLG